MTGSASLTKRPRTNAGASSVNVPSSATGFQTGQPWARPMARSSGPKAGARWTTPVPSSSETKEASTTVWAPSTLGYGGSYRRPTSVCPSIVCSDPPSLAEHRLDA